MKEINDNEKNIKKKIINENFLSAFDFGENLYLFFLLKKREKQTIKIIIIVYNEYSFECVFVCYFHIIKKHY